MIVTVEQAEQVVVVEEEQINLLSVGLQGPAGASGVSAHSALTELSFAEAGHTGFAGLDVINLFTQGNTFTGAVRIEPAVDTTGLVIQGGELDITPPEIARLLSVRTTDMSSVFYVSYFGITHITELVVSEALIATSGLFDVTNPTPPETDIQLYAMTDGTRQRITLDDDYTLSLNVVAGLAVGWSMTLIIQQDATGGHNVTWWNDIKWPGGIVPALTGTPNSIDVFNILRTAEDEFLGTYALNFG